MVRCSHRYGWNWCDKIHHLRTHEVGDHGTHQVEEECRTRPNAVSYSLKNPQPEGTLVYCNFLNAFQGMVLNEFLGNSDLPEGHDYIDQLGFDFISIDGCFTLVLLFLAFIALPCPGA
jgi:hypothetical protein